MNWVRFEFDNSDTWPKKNSEVIIRYVAKGSVRYAVKTWYETFPMREPNDFRRVHTYYSEYDEVKLYHDDENVLPLSTCFLTHWRYLEEPTDGYWKEYKHENGNTYTDKPWLTEQISNEENVNIEQLI